MPSQPIWMANLTRILEDLEVCPEVLAREDVENLLDVKPRTAQDLMSTAGGSVEGNRLVIPRQDFELYLRSRGGPELDAEEKRRRRQFAQRLQKIEVDWKEQPRLNVDLETIDKDALRRARKGLSGLPDGVRIARGQIVIEAVDANDALAKLVLLSQALGRGFAEIEELDERLKAQDAGTKPSAA